MSKYTDLKNNKPLLEVKRGAREVIFHTVSCMCDNRGKLRFYKNIHGDFKLDGCGFSISNWQMKYGREEIEWKADEGDWDTVADMINTETAVIESVVSR